MGAPPCRKARLGFTVVELAISLTLLLIVSGVVLMATRANSQAFRTGSTVAALDALAERAVDEICERLLASSRLQCDPQIETPFHTMQVDYQRAVDATGGVLTWGAPERLSFEYSQGELDDGVDNDGNGLIDEGRVVWTENPGLANEKSAILCNWVREYLEGETEDGTDENGNFLLDERGLSFDFDGNRVTVRLTLECLDPQGFRITRTVQRTIAFRNMGV